MCVTTVTAIVDAESPSSPTIGTNHFPNNEGELFEMNSPLNNFTGSLENALRSGEYNQYKAYATFVKIQYMRYTESRDFIEYMFSKPQDEMDVAKIAEYKELTVESRWHELAKHLTLIIQYQVEFIKTLPLFGNLVQDDQITAIKSCMLEMAIVRLSRMIDLEKDMVLYINVVMPIKECAIFNDSREVTLMGQVFDAAKAIARLKLTEAELGLFSILIFSLPDYHDTLTSTRHHMVTMYEHVKETLKQESEMNHPTPEGGVPVLDQLLAMTSNLRHLSVKHIEALRRFEAAYPDLTKFPHCLYKDLYCNLPPDNNSH